MAGLSRGWIRPVVVRSAWVVGVVAAMAIPLAARIGWEGRAELRAAENARAEGKTDLEIEHLGRAARWRLPGAGHDEQALDRLMAIGAAQETQGGSVDVTALRAYREVRGALVSTRAWGIPHRELFHRVNGKIATMMAAQERDFGTDVSGRGDPMAYHLELLEEVGHENRALGHAAAVAFLGWVLATLLFVSKGIDRRARVRVRPALLWGGLSLALLVAWMVAWRLS